MEALTLAKYTKEQINDILGLKGWLDSQIDVFNLYAVLTIGAQTIRANGKLSRELSAKISCL